MSTERAIPGGPEWNSLAPHHLARYLFAAQYAPGKRILDAGTGAGYGAALLHAQGAAETVAVDINPATIAAAQRTFQIPGITYLVDDCHRLEKITGPFDLIVNFENIEHLQHPEQFLAAAARLLGPAGIFITSTPDRASTPPFKTDPATGQARPANPHHFHEWFRDEFRALLAPHFRSIDMRVQVQTFSLAAREAAVESLRSALTFANPLASLLFRKTASTRQGTRAWRALDALSAPTLNDYPILVPALTPIYGTPYAHLAICGH